MLLWTPLFFSAAAYATTQMELQNIDSHTTLSQSKVSQSKLQSPHACHQTQGVNKSTDSDKQQHNGGGHVQHCGFCVSSVTPLYEATVNFVPLTPTLVFSSMWAPSSRNPSPDHRPPIDA